MNEYEVRAYVPYSFGSNTYNNLQSTGDVDAVKSMVYRLAEWRSAWAPVPEWVFCFLCASSHLTSPIQAWITSSHDV